MTSKNDITGDALQTKAASEAYRSGWDRIFGASKSVPEPDWTPEEEEAFNALDDALSPEYQELKAKTWKVTDIDPTPYDEGPK